MKSLPPALADHLASSVTTLCQCWKLTKPSGAVVGFTDHDRPLTFDGVTYEAAGGFTAGAVETRSGLNVDDLEVIGALASERLSERELAAGLLDNAVIEIWRVNWQDMEQRVLMRTGNLGEVRRSGTGFAAEVRGLAHRLNQPVGRLYQFACDADLGDTRCSVDLSDPAYRGTGTVTSETDRRVLTVDGIFGFDDGWFSRGQLTLTSGENAGIAREIKQHAVRAASVTIALWQALPFAIDVATSFEVTAGCDKQAKTCKARFANLANFRGFPHMPGNDFVQSYPNRGEKLDGGSRFKN